MMTKEGASSLVELIEELHRSASEASHLGFPGMARRLDACGFAVGSRAGDGQPDERALRQCAQLAHARHCLAMWRALLGWATQRGPRD
jgi:hypothetical protein